MDISAHYLSLFLGVEVGLAENRRLTVFPGWEPAKRGMRGRVVAVHTNRRCYHSHSHPNRRIRRRMTPLPRFGCASEGYDDGSWPLGLLFRYSPPPFFFPSHHSHPPPGFQQKSVYVHMRGGYLVFSGGAALAIVVEVRRNPFALDSGSWFDCGSVDCYGGCGRE